MNKSLTSKEIIEILSHQYADVNDIKKLGCCGKNKAYEYLAEIRNKIKDSKRHVTLPRGKVDMEYVIEFFELDEKKHIRRAVALGGVEDGI